MTFDQLQLNSVSLAENPEFPQYVKGSKISAQFFSPTEVISEESLILSDFKVKHVIVQSNAKRKISITPADTSTLLFTLHSGILWDGRIQLEVNQACLFDLAVHPALEVPKGTTRFVTITPVNGRWKILTSFFPWMRRRLVKNIRFYTNKEASDKMDAFFMSNLGVAEHRELLLLDWLGHHYLGVENQPKTGVK